jgi:cytoskeletal protein CcmA (bactofilin family)
VENDKTNINDSNVICIYVTWREGNTIHSIGLDSKALGLANKISHSITNSMPYRKSVDGGLFLSETSTPIPRTILCTSAMVYAGITPTLVHPFDSSTDLLTLYYHSAGAWFGLNQSAYDNTQYDDGTGLQIIGNNKYAVRWFYRSVGDVRQMFYVLGSNKYNNISDAKLEVTRPDLPILLRNHCMLVGRIIVQYNASSGLVENVQTTTFVQGIVQDHNDLTNLQGGDGVNYYHLSATTFGYLSAVSADIQSQLDGKGTVNFVGLSARDSFISISSSPITTSGTISFGFNQQLSGTFLGGPTSGTSAYPTFRKILANELQYQGTSPQFLKGDGSLDSNNYVTSSTFNSGLSKYLPLSGGTLSGTLSGTSISVSGNISANSFVKNGGTSGQFLKADGSVETNSFSNYLQVSAFNSNIVKYLPLSGGTLSGTLSGTSISVSGNISANSFVKNGGTSGQFLKADGTVDSNTYTTTSSFNSSIVKYLPLSGGTLSGTLSGTSISVSGNISANSFIGVASSSLSALQSDTLKTARTFVVSGDVSAASQTFDGSSNVIFSTVLSSVGTSGVYTKVQTDSKGRVISGSSLISSDIPVLNYLPLSGGQLTGNLSAINISANGSVILPYNPQTLAKNTLMIGSSLY